MKIRLQVGMALVDQGLISLANFLLGMSLIRATSKTEYGAYVLCTNAILLAQSLQNALVLSPMMTVVPPMQATLRASALNAARRIQTVFLAILLSGASICAWGLYLFGRLGPVSWGLVCGTIILLFGTLAREYARNEHYLEQRPERALAIDVLAFAGTAIAVAFVWKENLLSATSATILAGLLYGAASFLARSRTRVTVSGSRLAVGELWRELWRCGRWAIPSVIVTWLYSNAYVYIVSSFMNTEAVGDIGAARLLLVPISLLTAAWTNVYRPAIVRWKTEGDFRTISRTALRAVTGVFTLIILYSAVVMWTLPHLVGRVLSSEYAGLGPIVFAWCCYFLLVNVRTIAMAIALTDAAGFARMFFFGLLACGIGLPLTFLGAWNRSAVSVVLSVAACELVLLVLTWQFAQSAMKRERVAIQR